MAVTLFAVLKALGTDVQEPGPIDVVVLEVGPGAIVETLARLGLLLGLWLVPCIGRLGREVRELLWSVSERRTVGGVKSLNDSSPSGRMSGPGGPLAAAAARRSLTWAAVRAARPWVEEGAGCVAVVPPAARSCLYLERDGSSWLGPGVGWLAVALKDS